MMNYNLMKKVMAFICLAMTIHYTSNAALRETFKNKKLINSEFDKYYYKGLDKNYYDHSLEKETNNLNGQSSNKKCGMGHQRVINIHDNYLPAEYPVVVDLGSGFGACAKQMAILGYKVYSVDKDEGHIKYQKNNFCSETYGELGEFLQHVLLRGPNLIEQYAKECEDIKKGQEFIVDDITDIKSDKIPNKGWDIVLLTNVMPFLENYENALKMLSQVKNSISEKGIFCVHYRYANDEIDLQFHERIQSYIGLGFEPTNDQQSNECEENGGCTFSGVFRTKLSNRIN